MFPRILRVLLPISAALLVIGCSTGEPPGGEDPPGDGDGDGVGDGEVVGVTLPSAVSVVTVIEEDWSARAPFDTTGFDASSDFHSDTQRAHVYDPSMQPLDTVNMILCVLGQSGAADMVNEGPYIALVNMDACDKKSAVEDPGQSGAVELTEWTVDSSRADASSPMVAKIWFDEPDGPMDQPQTIMVEVIASESVSDTRPFGEFEMNFHGVNNQGEIHMKGMLRTVDNAAGLPQFEFINAMGGSANPSISDWSGTEATNVILDDADGSGGIAKTLQAFAMDNGFESHAGQQQYAVAFDGDFLLRARDDDDDDIADAEACADRSDFHRNIWRYNLYHRDASGAASAGQRVDMQSGFPFVFEDGASSVRGYYSYWGVWTDDGRPVPDGATITRYDYDTETVTEYTVAVSDGRLVKQVKNVLPLGSVTGDQFEYWGENPETQEWGQWLVAVNGDLDFELTHSVVKNDHGDDHIPLASPVVITPANEGEGLWLWSRTLGGSVVYNHASVSAEREIQFYAQEYVSPTNAMLGSGQVTLHCSDRCLKGGVTTAVDYNDLVYPWGEAHTYTLSVSSGAMSLIDDTSGSPVNFDAIDLASLGHDWGIDTGSMTTVASGDDSVTYRWETGPNDWNRQVSVIDSAGAAVELSRPVAFAYTHEASNDANQSSTHDGRTFLLEYGGDGDLWGFPYAQDEQGRHYAEFALADGVELSGDVDGDGDDDVLVVKATDLEYTMVEVATAQCAGAGLSTAALFDDAVLSLPTADDISGISFGRSDWPTVTDPPAVIEGDVQ